MDDVESRIDRLLQSTRAGSDSAVVELFETFRARLRRTILLRMDRRLQGRIDPSDVLQEAFIDYRQRIGEFGNHTGIPFFLWLRMLTCDRLHKIHRTHLETQKRDVRREQTLRGPAHMEASSISIAQSLVSQYTSVTEQVIREEVLHRLYQAIDAMEPMDREIIAMRHFEELTNKETSILLGISTTASSNRYVRALQRLREIMLGSPTPN